MMRKLVAREESFLLHKPFTISRLKPRYKTVVVTIIIEEAGIIGRGECQALNHADPSKPSPMDEIEAVRKQIEQGVSRLELQELMPACFGRNAVDCALWEIEARQKNQKVHQLCGLKKIKAVETMFTLSLDDSATMAKNAFENRDKAFLKLKLGSSHGDIERLQAVIQAAPKAKLILDANTSWTRQQLIDFMPQLKKLGVVLIEQPFPPEKDHWLQGIERSVAVIADESCRTCQSLEGLKGLYDGVNIKLDKAGGLTESLLLLEKAREAGFLIMVGCNLSSSLAIAPALILAQQADFIDLDSPLLLKNDREGALKSKNGMIFPPQDSLWPA